MYQLAVVNAKDDPLLFETAYNFLLPKEEFFCSLMHKVVQHDRNLYVVLNGSLVVSVFFYNGSTVLPCIVSCPQLEDIISCLSLFFKDADIFCVSGEESSVEFFKKAVKKSQHILPDEERNYILMQSESCPTQAVTARFAQKSDEEKIFEMHVNFLCEEVLPQWKKESVKDIIPSERISVSRAIEDSKIMVLENGGHIVSKAQITASTNNFILLGGVYTDLSERNKGFAKKIILYGINHAFEQNKKAVLFVENTNRIAFKCYSSAGFVPFGKHSILYYRK